MAMVSSLKTFILSHALHDATSLIDDHKMLFSKVAETCSSLRPTSRVAGLRSVREAS